ncbi:hypothetical protein DSM106972_004140 [Dulcicalothrix desertica PCC 7102]|uniref:Thiaminase-2/PQQC domain-containing protein n=1 Tax=Dulcicalothrix desertica PCC 7102 TaxID=232991 RepID=A0A3S1AV24_9CYAN|nr:hypothetical protein [Dulcicalothrix desertica]RUT09919.1 hypothetical protein DSM106972_004140 [Dulcicalothrix desertica PCC 7102]TWH51111.1 hypothetical protein CAL7102_05486 [Dulcicalothrix desertica PCC 7102]
MERILTIIEAKKQQFAQLDLFYFMQDRSLKPEHRLSFAPCMTHFVMSFSDLNKYVLRQENSNNKIQEIVNKYTYEDDEHWPWFLTDIDSLGFNNSLLFSDMLRFIWGEETKITRQIAYQVAGYCLKADAPIKIAMIQSLEAMADVFFSISSKITSELQATTKKEYFYFGNLHLGVESEHSMNAKKAKEQLNSIDLTEIQYREALEAVEQIFNIFSKWTYELLAYAHNHPIELALEEKLNTTLVMCR